MDPEGQPVTLPFLPANRNYDGNDDPSDMEMRSCPSAQNSDEGDDEGPKDETEELLRELKLSLDDELGDWEDFTYACGGSVPIDNQQASGRDLTTPSCRPVSFRWDSSDPSVPDDMHDETNRKALTLDPSRFSTSFSPYECGIIDIIAQIMRPIWLSTEHRTSRSVKAELHKLNIHAGPFGCSPARIDAACSTSQFGWLVVCLPIAHEGGQFEIRRKGKVTSFDWSESDPAKPCIQWAAFYCDCEHKTLEVRSGYSLTLKYSLHAVHGNGSLTGHYKGLDVKKLPLYKYMRTVLDNKSFMPKGGHLGIFTNHNYPHTSFTFRILGALRGFDMAIWECFKALNCDESNERFSFPRRVIKEYFVGNSFRHYSRPEQYGKLALGRR
ncbi:oxidoreductase [Hypoxylon sp. FL1857]|nr:oxidoreductase [Hypoxylon sp. FL1857]